VVPTQPDQYVSVLMSEEDEVDRVELGDREALDGGDS
jgi:hypothetical protein